MPPWLLKALEEQRLTAEELTSVADKVVAEGKEHSKQSARIEPTESELQQRYNM